MWKKSTSSYLCTKSSSAHICPSTLHTWQMFLVLASLPCVVSATSSIWLLTSQYKVPLLTHSFIFRSCYDIVLNSWFIEAKILNLELFIAWKYLLSCHCLCCWPTNIFTSIIKSRIFINIMMAKQPVAISSLLPKVNTYLSFSSPPNDIFSF